MVIVVTGNYLIVNSQIILEDIQNIVRGNKNVNEWRDYSKSGCKPDNIPSNPNATYKNSGWTSFIDWLGIGTIATQNLEFFTFE